MPERPPRRVAPLVVWIARLAWVFVAIAGGAAVDAALDGRSSAVRWTAAVGGWTVWAAVALALAIPSVRTLTLVRVAAPLAAVATVAAALAGAPTVDLLLLGVPAFVALAAVLTPELAIAFVQASAYGDEERFPLRAPAAAGTAAVLAWAVWAAAVVAGPLLLAAQRWLTGGIVTLVAIAATAFLPRRWHRLSRRWLVLVPAGLVVHDPVVLADTLMLRRDQITSIGLAREGTPATDFTGPASGYALEIATAATVSAVYAFTPAEPNGRPVRTDTFLVSPTRPGRALDRAAARGLPAR